MKTIFKFLILMMLAALLVLSLGACSKDKKSEAEDPGTETAAEEPAGPADTAEEDPAAADEGQDLSGFTSFEDWTPMFPDHADSIVWDAIPKDFIGGFGAHVTPKADNEGYVNVRNAPSIEADAIDKLQHEKDSEILWTLVTETYVKDGQLFVGEYQVKDGDYTWIAVTSFDPNSNKTTTGWVAREVVELWGI